MTIIPSIEEMHEDHEWRWALVLGVLNLWIVARELVR